MDFVNKGGDVDGSWTARYIIRSEPWSTSEQEVTVFDSRQDNRAAAHYFADGSLLNGRNIGYETWSLIPAGWGIMHCHS